ncbi:DUF484 family protein [Motiliproteus sp. SC1-56]|uniref:DUF484 family protein n=1 Tax=Motiliproteus sp. SC1-56 TaxID=2799565 RepID=UPI001A8EEE3B|nr:DUF484 family protein [Motiliproteus sp. SC1-56]
MSNNQPANTLPDAAQVAEFLKQHPDFFTHHQGLLGSLRIPHASGGAISLVERQTSLLREQNREMRSQLNELLDAARQNDLQFERTKRLILAMLEAHNLDELVMAVDEGLCQDFNGDLTRIILFDEHQRITGNHLKCLPPAEAETQVAELTESDWAICGSLTEPQRRFLFDDRADKVLSAAVVPLVKGRNLGLLAIGSFEANYFHSSMGTLFLNYVGEVLSRVLFRLSRDDA